VEDAARRGASVTHRLLAFARRDELRAEPVEVPVLLDGIREVLEHTLGGVIAVRLDLAPGLPRVLADRSRLETVLVNLAINARDAMPGGGALIFSASAEAVRDGAPPGDLAPGTYIRLIVTDTGAGMDVATLARAAEPFFTTKPQGQGTGLGLPMARGFAEQSGGTLAISSERGRGTSVALWLPATHAGVAASGLAQQGEPAVPAAGRTPRVLLVDDEDLVREVIAEQLADCGYNVVQAEGGALALKLMDAGEAVDVLVSDLSMPGMDGIALIRAAQGRSPRLPAILLTGYAGEAAAIAVGGVVGASFTLLRKPIGGAQLADHLAMLLEVALSR
jgi:CheY-like chemotaxis protein